MRVGVIGCGLIGAATARELQLRGASVVIYEAHRPGQGTSGTTFAWVNAYDKQPRAYHELNVAGIQAHAELQALPAPGPQWFFQTGNLVCPADEDVIARLETWGYPVRRLTAREARELEPDVRIPDEGGGAVLLPDEGFVLPVVLLARLLGEALDQGAELRCPAHVEHFAPEPAGVRVHLADGSSELVDVLVACVGRWTEGLMTAAGHTVPMVDHAARGSAAVGFLAYTEPAAVRLARVVTTPGLNVRPDGGGRLVLQALDLDGGADPAVDVDAGGSIGQELGHRLTALLRGGEDATLRAIRVGRRALPTDGLSVVGYIDGAERLYIVTTHSGVTLAPVLARLAAAEITGAPEPVLEPFRPGRFASTPVVR